MFKYLPWIRIWRSLRIVGGLAAIAALLAACGGGGAGSAQPAAGQAPAGGPVTLEIGTSPDANVFKYDKDTLEAPAGSKITLKFTNNTQAADEIGHNWVLVKPGQEQSVLDNGIAAGDDKDWLNVDDPGIIAHTSLLEGGESDTITFDAPPPRRLHLPVYLPRTVCGRHERHAHDQVISAAQGGSTLYIDAE